MLQLINEIPVPYKDSDTHTCRSCICARVTMRQFCLFLWLLNCILELFRRCGLFFPLCWYTLIVNKYIFHFYGYFGIFPKKNIDLFSLIFWKENYNCDIVNENKRADFNECNFIL